MTDSMEGISPRLFHFLLFMCVVRRLFFLLSDLLYSI